MNLKTDLKISDNHFEKYNNATENGKPYKFKDIGQVALLEESNNSKLLLNLE